MTPGPNWKRSVCRGVFGISLTAVFLFLTLLYSQPLRADNFSLSATATASACNEGEIGSLNNGACNTFSSAVTSPNSIVLSPVISTIDVASAQASGSVTYGSVTGSASASASPTDEPSSGSSQFIGEWNDTLTVTSATLSQGTPVNLEFTLTVSGSVTCSPATVLSNSGQVSGQFEFGLNVISAADTTCGTTIAQTQMSTYATTVGAVIDISGTGQWDATANAPVGSPGSSVQADPPAAQFFVDLETPGASYTTASGVTYFSSVATPEPSGFLLLGTGFLGFAMTRMRKYIVRKHP